MNTNNILLSALGDDMDLKFETLPITEAAADASHFVVEADNTAGGNLTGVGGGLAGSDLVFTQFNSVAAASGGWTDLAAQKGFGATNTFIDTFLRNSTGFAFLWHLRNFSFASQARVVTMSGTSPVAWGIDAHSSGGAYMQAGVSGKFGIQASDYYGGANDVFPSAAEAWMLLSVDYSNELAFFGVAQGTTQPDRLNDFIFYGVTGRAIAPPASAVSATAGLNNIIGANSSPYFSGALGFKSFTAKKGASVTRA